MAKVKLGKATAPKKALGYLGGRLVIQISDVAPQGKALKHVILEDGTSYMMSEKDLQAQLTDSKGEFTHL